MTIDEVTQYWIPAVRAIYGRHRLSYETCMELDNLLGLNEYHEYGPSFPNYKPLSEDLKKLLVLLAGPHSKAILKAYRIQKGLE